MQAWGVSIAVHAAVVLACALALGAGHQHRHHEPLAPARLVWVEPAAPARGMVPAPPADGVAPAPPAREMSPEAPEAPSAPTAAAAALEPAPVPVAKKPEPVRGPVPRLARRAEMRPAPAAKPREPPSVAAVPEQQRELDTAAAQASTAGVNGEAAKGVAGGAAGGLGDAPLRVSSVATPPELVDRIVPEYPSRARALEVEGQVLLEVVLDRNGRPEAGIRVLRSVVMLDAAAIAAVRQWRFRPARDAEGHAVRVVMEVPVRFVLR